MFPRNTLILFVVICVCMVSCAKDDITPDPVPVTPPIDKTIGITPETNNPPVAPAPSDNPPIETEPTVVNPPLAPSPSDVPPIEEDPEVFDNKGSN